MELMDVFWKLFTINIIELKSPPSLQYCLNHSKGKYNSTMHSVVYINGICSSINPVFLKYCFSKYPRQPILHAAIERVLMDLTSNLKLENDNYISMKAVTNDTNFINEINIENRYI